MAVVAPGMVGPARAALVAAGFASVSVLPAGVLRFAGSVSSASAVLGRARITAQVSVDRVERFSALPNDPGLTGQWNVPLIDVPAAWNITTGSPSIVVADLDSGVDGTHPDLQGKLAPGFDITTGAPLGSGNTDDSSGHGTAVAGIIGAATNNRIGVAGIGWQTKVAEVRLSDPPALSEIVAGLLWATNAGYPIINLSFTGCADPTEAVAIQYARQHGVLVVAAAGNDALDGNPLDFPAAFPGVIAVGATDHNGVRAAYSEYGSQVSLVAPGGSADGNPSDDLPLLAPGGGTRTGSGTSFAAPQVAAVAALALAASPSITPDDAGALMMATAAHIQSSPDVNYGRGIVDAGATVADASHLSRAAGSDRYGTAAAVAALGWPRNATIAYVASGLTFPDALATGALAGVKPGPILLTDQCSLPASTAAALKRLQPDAIYVVGGTAAVCSAVDTAITSATGLIPSRLAGDDRYGTAEAISKLGWPGTASTVYVTTGVNFPDGLTGSARAAKDGAPLLLTDQCTLPLATRAELLRLQPTTVKLIGGTAAICAGVASSISSALPGATVTRIAGVDRVSTGTMVAADGWSTASSVLVASADNFPDALSAGALAALEKMPLMINGSCSIDPPVAAEVPVLKPSTIVAIGGASALCGAAVAPLVVSISAQPLF
jgi:cell wall-associated protease